MMEAMPETMAAGPGPRLEDICAVRDFAVLAERPDYSVLTVTCRDDHRRWSAVESRNDYRLVLVRRGTFRRRAAGVSVDLDPTVAYLGVPGEEEYFAHPADGGDVCTAISLSPRLWRNLAGEDPPSRIVYVDAAMDLAHRRLLHSGHDVDYALAEQLAELVRPSGRALCYERLVDRARQAIAADHPEAAGLFSLADLVGTSPYRLSRAFTRCLGVSVTRYRNRVRVARAMDRLEAGQPHLGQLAADLGFADQSHLTRTVKEHLGHTPTVVRELLRGHRRPSTPGLPAPPGD
jgi:AraC-like DNA-binding protein